MSAQRLENVPGFRLEAKMVAAWTKGFEGLDGGWRLDCTEALVILFAPAVLRVNGHVIVDSSCVQQSSEFKGIRQWGKGCRNRRGLWLMYGAICHSGCITRWHVEAFSSYVDPLWKEELASTRVVSLTSRFLIYVLLNNKLRRNTGAHESKFTRSTPLVSAHCKLWRGLI